MDSLPQEILEYILDYVPLAERIQKRLVNKRFRDLIPGFYLTFDEENNLKNQLSVLGSLMIIPKIVKKKLKNSVNYLYFRILDRQTRIAKYKLRLTTYLDDEHILVRRELFLDENEEFSKMDDIDEADCSDGIKKLLSSVQNIIKITRNDQLWIEDTILYWKETVKLYFNNPVKLRIESMKSYESLLESYEYTYVNSLMEKNHSFIFEILGEKLKMITPNRRDEYIDLLLFILFK